MWISSPSSTGCRDGYAKPTGSRER
jgi:hypothetical protein